MARYGWSIRIGLVGLALMVLAGCGGDPAETAPPRDSTAAQAVQPSQSGAMLPMENRDFAGFSISGRIPCTSADGFYLCSGSVSFYDVPSGKYTALCAQVGCAHNDPTCRAYFGNVSSVIEYRGKLYGLENREGSGAAFLEKDLSTGEIRQLRQWSNEENRFVQITFPLFEGGRCVLRESWTTRSIEDGQVLEQTEAKVYLMDLATGETRFLYDDNGEKEQSIMAMKGSKLLLRSYRHDPNSANVNDRVDSLLELWDLDTGERTVVADQAGGLKLTADPNAVYGYKVVYQVGDSVYVYDLERETAGKELTLPNIVNYWIQDDHIFAITKDENNHYDVYYQAAGSGELVHMENGGLTSGMMFSILEETQSCFIGKWEGNSGDFIIQKDDFYAERYDRAQRL